MKTDAKMKMLQELKKMATDMMSGDLKGKMDGLKKVTVAAEDEHGLQKGLDKAKEILGQEKDPMDMTEHMSEEESEEPETEEEMPETEELSPLELEQKIKELQAKLEMLKK